MCLIEAKNKYSQNACSSLISNRYRIGCKMIMAIGLDSF